MTAKKSEPLKKPHMISDAKSMNYDSYYYEYIKKELKSKTKSLPIVGRFAIPDLMALRQRQER